MRLKRLLKLICCILIVGCASTAHGKKDNKGGLKHPPKNIVIMISDGCGYNHVDAASLYQYGRTGKQAYEKFPVRCAMSTFMAGGSYDPNRAWASFDYVKRGYTDSAAAATAMSTGVKTYSGAIGVGVNVGKKPLTHLVDRCEQLGKATGVITTVQLSHATPAGFVTHNESRNNYAAIANEMFYKSALEVIMGAGHPMYDNNNQLITEPNNFEYKYVGGKDTWTDLSDGRLTGADGDGDGLADNWTIIEERSDFQVLMDGPTPSRIIGIAQVNGTLQQRRSGGGNAVPYTVELNQNVPTLAEMTQAALNVLDNDPDGFFLMVEGGAVDWAGHGNQSGRVIEEEIDFNKSVEAVLEWVKAGSNWDETLVIVTADHECGYLTGPDSGQAEDGPTWNSIINNGRGKMPSMEWHSGSHTNSLVPFYARGRGAYLFKKAAANIDSVRGDYIDNTDIAKTIFALLAD
ncbi:MAG: alkaline phosphatase [Phycisphaerales bacterium]|jgi:alkaline phosphatase